MTGEEFFILLALTVFWGWTFVSLMRMPDTAFKGRYDKLIFGLLLIFPLPLGALVFHAWRFAQRTEDLTERDVAAVFDDTGKDS